MFTAKTQLNFDLSPAPFSVAAILAAAYATPTLLRERLGDLARLNYLRASLKGCIVLSTTETTTITVHLKAGAFDVEVVVPISAGDRAEFEIPDIDVSAIVGQIPLYIEADVDVASGGACTAQVFASLDLEMPLVVAGCG